MIHYFTVSKKLNIDAGASVQVDFVNQNQPFEGLTFWAKTGSVGNVDLTPNLDGAPIAAKKLVGVATVLPQSILLDGIFPPSAPVAVAQKAGGVVSGVPGGFVPGLLVENKGASPIVVTVHIVARSYGPS